MSKRKIVVLGGTGFVGSHLVPALARAGWEVVVPTRNAEAKRDLAVVPDVRVVSADVYDRDVLAKLLVGADAAINLVGILNESGFTGAGFRRAHVDLTACLIASCDQAGVTRLLQMSSLNAGRGSSHYLTSRGDAEKRVRSSQLRWTIFQPSVIFGPGDGLYCRFAHLLKLTPVLPLARAGAKFAPVYIGDVVAAFVKALGDRSTVGKSFELYGPDVYTLRDIVEYTRSHLGVKRVIIGLPDVIGRLQAAACDFVPGRPFSSDNYRSLLIDSVGGVDGLFRLGIERTPVDAVMPALLSGDGKQRRLDDFRAQY